MKSPQFIQWHRIDDATLAEEAAAGLALHALDAAGKRGLAESERRRRAREAAVLVEGDHVTHVAEIE